MNASGAPLAPDPASQSAATLSALAAGAGRLYSLPAVAMKVLELTANPRVDTRALKECIENDPALTGKLLQVVNSSLFGLSREILDLGQALTLLGSKPLKLLVLGFSLPADLFANVAADVLRGYWNHALTKAVAAREIAQSIWGMPGDDAFLAGLLQDLGMLVLIQHFGQPYARLVKQVTEEQEDLWVWEADAMGFNHTQLSGAMLARWGLPESLHEAVVVVSPVSEAEPDDSADDALAQVLHLAELLAQSLADGNPRALARLRRVGDQSHLFSDAQLEELVETLQQKVTELADVLKLQLPDGIQYTDLLRKAHDQLADAAQEAAEDLLRRGSSAPAVGPSKSEAADLSALRQASSALTQAVKQTRSREVAAAEAAALPPAETAVLPPAGSPAAPPVVTPSVSPPAAPSVVPPKGSAPPSAKRTDARPRGDTPGEPLAESADPQQRLLAEITIALSACRQARRPLSLLLAEYRPSNRKDAAGDAGRPSKSLSAACQAIDHEAKVCLPRDDGSVAMILPHCERNEAIDYGHELLSALPDFTTDEDGRRWTATCVGVVSLPLPPKNFPPGELLGAADRCLRASRAAGGGVVKSIEIL